MDVIVIESDLACSARWIKENANKNAVIPAHDMGALGYFSAREILEFSITDYHGRGSIYSKRGEISSPH